MTKTLHRTVSQILVLAVTSTALAVAADKEERPPAANTSVDAPEPVSSVAIPGFTCRTLSPSVIVPRPSRT